MPDLKTDATLIERLRQAATVAVSADDRRRQKVSFVYGNLSKDSGMTRAQVARRLAHAEEARG